MNDFPRLTILFDNYPGTPGLESLWGFSALVQIESRTILFDTGSNGRVLLRNMAALNIPPESLDLVFLSHPHWDHIGGLDSLLEINPQVTVVVHVGFSKHLIQDLGTLCGGLLVVGAESQEIAPGVFSTGMLESEPPEHALILEAGGVTAVIAGCAHPGMEQIVARATAVLGRAVDWAIGGFHLMHADARHIGQSIRSLQDLGVHYVVPTHCSGDDARRAFRRAFAERCLEGGVGRRIRLVARHEGGSPEVTGSDPG